MSRKKEATAPSPSVPERTVFRYLGYLGGVLSGIAEARLRSASPPLPWAALFFPRVHSPALSGFGDNGLTSRPFASRVRRLLDRVPICLSGRTSRGPWGDLAPSSAWPAVSPVVLGRECGRPCRSAACLLPAPVYGPSCVTLRGECWPERCCPKRCRRAVANAQLPLPIVSTAGSRSATCVPLRRFLASHFGLSC